MPNLMYRNFHFNYADQEIVAVKIPLKKGGKGVVK